MLYLLAMKNCLYCSKELKEGSRQRVYCSVVCQGTHSYETSVRDWKSGARIGHYGVTKAIAPFVRRYMFSKFESKCCKCGWNTSHPKTGKPPLDINHIDGDASNTVESNLELVCPNCHSLTLNYKNRNKGNGKRIR